jgi:predicted dehydrogenase
MVGTGFIAAVHASCAARSRDVDLVAVAGVRGRARPGKLTGLDPGVRLATIDELLEMQDVEAVLVCSRTVDHPEHAIAALAAGKHLLLEKPGAIGTDAQARIREAAASHPDLVVRVAYHRRHDARFRELARLIAAGAIGRPFAIQMESRENFPPGPDDLAAGGFIMDVGVHDFDTARWLLGADPQTVAVVSQRAVYADADLDQAYITIALDGAMAFTHLARTNTVGMDIRCEVLGEYGSVVFDRSQRNGEITLLSTGSVFAADCREFFAETYQRQMDDFAAACRGRDALNATLEDDRWAVATAVAARAAATREGWLAVGPDWPWPAGQP